MPEHSVLRYGAKGNGITDDTQSIQNALDRHDTIYFPNGTYLVSTLVVGNNKTILTEGYKVVIKQNDHSIGKQIIKIEGSNVVIYPLTCIGNIATDTSEFNIAIFISPSPEGNTKNIAIKGLIAKNIRGDGVCVGTGGNTYPENVSLTNIRVINCFRNGISVVGGKNIYIKNVNVNHSGMEGIDIEGEGAAPNVLENIHVTNLVAGNICISGGSLRAKKITLTDLRLDGRRQKSSPPFRPMQDAGILIFNAEDLTISNAKVTNMPGFAIFAGDVEDNRRVLSDRIQINGIKLQNNSLTDEVYNAYVCVMGVKKVSFKNLKAKIGAKKILFLGKRQSFAGTQEVLISDSYIDGGLLVGKYCSLRSQNLTINTKGECFAKMQSVSIKSTVITSSALRQGKKAPANAINHIVPVSAILIGKRPSVEITNSVVNKKKIRGLSTQEHNWLL